MRAPNFSVGLGSDGGCDEAFMVGKGTNIRQWAQAQHSAGAVHASLGRLASTMPRPAGPRTPPRYSLEDATAEVLAFLNDKVRGGTKRGMKARLAAACAMTPSHFSHCLNPGRKEKFRIEDFGSIAEEIGAPAGWPWIPWGDGMQLDGIRYARAQAAQKQHR